MDSIQAWEHTFSFVETIGPVQAWEYPYDKWCSAFWGPLRPVTAHSGYIYQVKHDYVTSDQLGPTRLVTGLLWVEIIGSPCLKVVHAKSSAMGCMAPAQFKILETSCGLAMHAV